MKNYTFNKEQGNWYIDLPNWEGTKAELQMVAGADTLLDKLSNHGTSVNVTISTEKKSLEGFQTLKRIIQTPPNGCMYHLGIAPVWLCNVTKFVFEGVFPKKIHFKVEEINLLEDRVRNLKDDDFVKETEKMVGELAGPEELAQKAPNTEGWVPTIYNEYIAKL